LPQALSSISSLVVPIDAMTRPEAANSAISATTPTDQSAPITPSGMPCARQCKLPKL
jgi:hypothetical protein